MLDNQELDSLVQRVQKGDSESFRPLFDATYPELRSYVSARTPSPEQVDEVVQATYVAAFESLHRYTAQGAFLGWLKGIAFHRLDRLRREQHRFIDAQPWIANLVAEPEDDRDMPASPAVLARLRRCLEALAPGARQMMEQRHLQGHSVQVMADGLGRSAASVSVTLSRIRTRLRECLGGHDDA
jgi:RNA polymerase sigma-70 factor (ECF subfamily)